MPRAFVCGCIGTILALEERAFLKDADPLGVILFKRNIGTPEEVRRLTDDIRDALGRADAFVMVDQEGGRVQRLGPPHWRRYPAAGRFAAIQDIDERARSIRLCARLIADDLKAVGIDMDCLPVLDVPVAGAHDVIGDRAYATAPELVARLGRAAAEGLMDGGVVPIMKHVPGHGRAGADSHLALPVVEASLQALETSDFVPFRQNNDLPAAMTAHVVFTAIDPDRPATISPIVVSEIVRGAIAFDGLLFSDDLSMKALPGDFRSKAEGLFAAGVDIALHCSGDRAEAAQVASVAPVIAGDIARRVQRARNAANRPRTAFDSVDAARTVDSVLAAMA